MLSCWKIFNVLGTGNEVHFMFASRAGFLSWQVKWLSLGLWYRRIMCVEYLLDCLPSKILPVQNIISKSPITQSLLQVLA